MKRVLLIGGSGQLGTAIRLRWNDWEIVAPARRELAIEQRGHLVEALDRIRPDVLINAAAFHDVDRCETHAYDAFAVNAFAVGEAAELAGRREVLFVTISTDYVFDGKTSVPYDEEAPANPLSVYGMSKRTGEYLALQGGERSLVVRTCGLYGVAASTSRHPLIERVLWRSAGGEPVRIVDDVVASPTFAGDLAWALRQLIEADACGLYHAVNDGAVSWYEFARMAANFAGKSVSLEPICADQWKAAAPRPRFSALANAKLAARDITMPSWQAGIAAYLGIQVR
ncbi:MAG: dTDP-4-dehydrorhamnose reductase [Candidatus Eremiobacteraeota bacterium]|nr:dTDP-4-dehydrorhamnose reductase [Candidatus Eremiobacteraeota bacterium]